MNRTLLELYSDCLLASLGQTSATRLSHLLEGAVSHDQITRFLHQWVPLYKTVWCLAKPLVRKIQSPDGVLIVEDSVEEHPHSITNGIIEWHYNHSVGRVVKGLNFNTAFYAAQLEGMRMGHRVNHFQLHSRWYIAALRASWAELQVLRQTSGQPYLPIA